MHLLSRSRLLLFAFGDFAFNLFWQSIMLFLLFYYTDALELPIGVAAPDAMSAPNRIRSWPRSTSTPAAKLAIPSQIEATM